MEAGLRRSEVSDLQLSPDHSQHHLSVRISVGEQRPYEDHTLAEHDDVSPMSCNASGVEFPSAKQPRVTETRGPSVEEINGFTPPLPSHSSTSPRHPHNGPRPLNRFNNWWTFEISSFVGSVAALLAIIGILVRYNGRPGPEWPDHIAINSVLSWFTTLMKAMMFVPIASCISQASWNRYRDRPQPLKDVAIFDAASRGLLGSLRLLLHLRFIHVVSLGAFVTVLAFGIDPFVQQAVSVAFRSMNSATSASIGRAQSFLLYEQSDDPTSPIQSFPQADLVGAIYSGIFMGHGYSDQPPAVNPTCSTGNCTFPAYQSLAVCSVCQDVNHALERRCNELPSTPRKRMPEINSTYCTLSLPNGLKLNQTGGYSLLGAMASSAYLPPVIPPPFGNVFSTFTRIVAAFDNNSTTNATQCSLAWCIKKYQSSVTNGHLTETSRVTYGDAAQTGNFVENKTMNSMRTELVAPSIDLPPARPPNINSNNNVTNSSMFTIGYLASSSLSSFLATKLTLSNSIATFPWDEEGDVTLATGLDVTANDTSNRALTDIIQVIRNPTPSLDALFSNIAAALTVVIRNTNYTQQSLGTDGGDYIPPITQGVGPANGTSTYNEVYIQVRWAWVVFPAALVALTGVLLVATIIQTNIGKVPVWKSNMIPLAMGGLQEVPSQSQHQGQSVAESWQSTGLADGSALQESGAKLAGIEHTARGVNVKMADFWGVKKFGRDEEK